MIRAATLCSGDWVLHTPSGKPFQIQRDNLTVSGREIIGYDFEPIMLDEEFFIHNGFAPTPGDTGIGYRYVVKAPELSYIDWWNSEDTYKVTISGNGGVVSFERNIAVHELQMAMRLCKIHKPFEIR